MWYCVVTVLGWKLQVGVGARVGTGGACGVLLVGRGVPVEEVGGVCVVLVVWTPGLV